MSPQTSSVLVERASRRMWIASLSNEQISAMSRTELLEVVVSYQMGPAEVRLEDDHRRFLSRPELERLVYLVRGHCQRT